MESQDLLNKALDFANLSLDEKKRLSGETVVQHCQKVVEILKRYRIKDPTTLAAALLHHSISDGAATREDLVKEFGEDIANLVEHVEGLQFIKTPESMAEVYQENFRKMFLVMARDLRVVFIKLADILDNLRTLNYLPVEKQKRVAKETVEIFAPLAERLGLAEMKGEMQDLAFPYLDPEGYERVIQLFKTNREKLEKRMLKLKAELKEALDREQIPYTLESRVKHLYSLYIKLKRPEINFDLNKIYDLIALRVITDSEENCYRTLDVVHHLWSPLPNYVRDYIAHPKANGYQSIHTTVFGPHGLPFEIQIRTEKMHYEAEYGVAAHWRYSEVKGAGVSDQQLTEGTFVDSKVQWVQNLVKWQEEIADNEQFIQTIKTDLFGETIFVLTPKGDVKDLPKGATPVDFAYAVHTDIGNRAIGAKVNGRFVSLDTQLKNGDVVEILVSKDPQKKPSRDWLKFVITHVAKKNIRKAYLDSQVGTISK